MKVDDLRPKLEALTPDELADLGKEVYALQRAKEDLEEIRATVSDFTNPQPRPRRAKKEKVATFDKRLLEWHGSHEIPELDPAIRALALVCARNGHRLAIILVPEEFNHDDD
jgi:hypothetical protein